MGKLGAGWGSSTYGEGMTDEDPWPLALVLLTRRCPDFVITQEGDGSYRATPRYEVTALLSAAGCRTVLQAPTATELETQVATERMVRSRVLASLWSQSPTPETQAYNRERLHQWLDQGLQLPGDPA